MPRLAYRLAITATFGGLMVVGVLYMNQLDRDGTNAKFLAPELRQINAALDAYASANGGTYPDRLDVLADLLPDREVFSGVTFHAPGRKRADLAPSDYVLVQPEPAPNENAPPRLELRADGRVEYLRQ